MPWSGKSFAAKHNHSLKGAAASKAASIASAIVREGGDEGVAIATANKYANKHRASLKKQGRMSEGAERRVQSRHAA